MPFERDEKSRPFFLFDQNHHHHHHRHTKTRATAGGRPRSRQERKKERKSTNNVVCARRSTLELFGETTFEEKQKEDKPPKKKDAVEEEPLGPWSLGRFSSNLKVGIVGMPNVGKSTLYNALTNCAIPAENFPFCTIDPNNTRVNVPDERF